jgi:hypothetical protein
MKNNTQNNKSFLKMLGVEIIENIPEVQIKPSLIISEKIILKYRKRILRENDLIDIRKLISDNPTESRYRLSKMLCEFWDWRQENGILKDMVCRSLMLTLHRSGHIKLPDVRVVMRNPIVERHHPAELDESFDKSSLEMPLKQASLLIKTLLARKTKHERLFNSLIQSHHYLNYTNPIGEHLKYLFFINDRPVACALWTSSALRLKLRDDYIGWNKKARDENVRMIAYNSRFLILPWVRIKFLASHLLGKISRQISEDWNNLYNHPVHLLETYIDPERFKGSCYRAANWKMIGLTKGKGIRSRGNVQNRSVKEMFVYPCSKKHIKKLRHVPE